MDKLEVRIRAIENRNRRVEADKAWETSLARKFMIAILTYVVIASYMWVIGVRKPFLNAVIPTAGFLLSTLTLSVVKSLWLKYAYKRK